MRFILLSALALSLTAFACGDDDEASPPAATPLPDGGVSPAPEAGAPDASLPVDGGPDAGDPYAGTLRVLTGNPATGFADGTGEAARFSGPSGSAVMPDGSAVLICDTFNSLLRRLDLATGVVTTIAGRVQVAAVADGVGAEARVSSPRGAAVSPDGKTFWFADGPTIRKYDVASQMVTTVAGTPNQSGYVDGTGDVVRFGFLLHDLEVSADGATVYVSDRSNNRIRALDVATGAVSTIAGAARGHADGVGTAAQFDGPGGIALVGSVLYVADTFNHVLRRLDLATRAVTTVAGTVGETGTTDGIGAAARFDTSQGLAAKGEYLYAGGFDGLLRRIALSNFAVETLVGNTDEAIPLDGPAATARLGIAFAPPLAHPTADAILYMDRSASSVRRIDLTTRAVATVAGAKDPEVTRDGTLLEARFQSPWGLAADDTGATMFVADDAAHVLRKIDVAGNSVTTFCGAVGQTGSTDGACTAARFDTPAALAWDETARHLYVVDEGGVAIRDVDVTASSVVTLAGSAGDATWVDGAFAATRFVGPGALALDRAGRRLFVADVGDDTARIRVLDLAARTTTTLFGGTRATAAPANGALNGATLNSPAGLAFDPAGERLFVTESGRGTVRVVDLRAGSVSVLAGLDGERGPGDGTFTEARFAGPRGLAWHAAENALYVADYSGNTIRKLDFATQTVTTWLGDPSREGGIAAGQSVPFAGATLYFPTAPTWAGGKFAFLGEQGVYLATPASP